jgi:hypothetical protein
VEERQLIGIMIIDAKSKPRAGARPATTLRRGRLAFFLDFLF